MAEQDFGPKLRELRKRANLSQRELAEKVGVNFSYLSKIENGVLPPPSESLIEKLAAALQTDRDDLLILAGKIPSDIAEVLKNKKTLELLRSAKIMKKLGNVPVQKKPGESIMNRFKWNKGLSRVAIPLVLVAAMATSLWFAAPQPARALQVSFPTLPNGTLGTSHVFSVTVDIATAELVPIQNINLEIFNTTNPTVYKATANNLPLTKGASKSYTSLETGNAGPISVTATSPSDNWAYFSGTGYANWQGTGYSFGTTFGYGYGAPGARITYTGTWVSPSGWPTGNYQAKVTIIATSSTLSQSFVTNSTAFTLTAPTAGGGSTPGVTTVDTVVNSQGVFQTTVVARSADDKVQATIPSGTTGKTAAGAPLTAISITQLASPPAPPAQSNIIGLAYDFGPNGATFSPPITVSITYDPTKIPAGVAEQDLKIAFFDSAQNKWVELTNITVDTVTHTISGRASHFTPFGVIAFVPRPAAFVVSGLNITPNAVVSGQSVTITASVNNTGDLPGTYPVTLKINNAVESTTNLAIAGNTRQIATFVITKTNVGTYTVDVNGLPGSFTVKAADVPPPPASFTIGGLTVTPSSVGSGQSVTITATVTNSGGTSGAYKVTLKINNAVETSSDVTLAAGASQAVTFTTSRTAAGVYQVDVNSLPGSFTVTAATPPSTEQPPQPPAEPTGVSFWVWVLIIAIVIIIAVAGVVIWRRSRY